MTRLKIAALPTRSLLLDLPVCFLRPHCEREEQYEQ